MFTAVMLRVSPTSTSVSFESSAATRFAVVAFSLTATLSASATGASLVLATVMSKTSDTAALALSVAVTLMLRVPTSALTGVPLKVRVAALNASQEGSAEPLDSVAP